MSEPHPEITQSKARKWTAIDLVVSVLIAIGSVVLLVAANSGNFELKPIEAWAVITGAVSVWLMGKEHVWNWPISIVCSGLYFVVLRNQKLYGNAGLQIVYVALALLGWYWWLFGGNKRTELQIAKTTARAAVALVVAFVGLLGTFYWLFTRWQDPAPFLDALTTAGAVVGQYMQTRKLIENWPIWVAVDLVTAWLLYGQKLQVSAGLWLVFTGMAVAGWIEWRRTVVANP